MVKKFLMTRLGASSKIFGKTSTTPCSIHMPPYMKGERINAMVAENEKLSKRLHTVLEWNRELHKLVDNQDEIIQANAASRNRWRS
jgi:hypothetical protein